MPFDPSKNPRALNLNKHNPRKIDVGDMKQGEIEQEMREYLEFLQQHVSPWDTPCLIYKKGRADPSP